LNSDPGILNFGYQSFHVPFDRTAIAKNISRKVAIGASRSAERDM